MKQGSSFIEFKSNDESQNFQALVYCAEYKDMERIRLQFSFDIYQIHSESEVEWNYLKEDFFGESGYYDTFDEAYNAVLDLITSNGYILVNRS